MIPQHIVAALWAILSLVAGFNIDVENPSVRVGPRGSEFGFAVAPHFRGGRPNLIVGAPKAASGQPGTVQAGAAFACDVAAGFSRHCDQLNVEYPTGGDFHRPPQRLGNKVLHREGKNHQLLGFVVKSMGTKDGQAMVCAPLLRYGENAYTDGVCYLLRNDLNHSGVISTCHPLPKKDRHNDYGACEQGFSAFMDEKVLLTGLPGARKWTGGVFGRYSFLVDGFPDSVDRWTMEVPKSQNGIVNLLTSHDYLGYSVTYGRFGFWFEEKSGENFTVVSGATRFAQTGAVLFLPFRKKSRPEEERLLGLDDEHFKLVGTQLGSGFGYNVISLDLNADGFDDLVVSAPFEFHFDEDIEFGGAVYVYFSRGATQPKSEDSSVFHEPIVIRGLGANSQFGLSLAKLGNIDNDVNGYDDFAVGAPFADEGMGVVYIFHGASRDSFSTKAAQTIRAKDLQTTLGSHPLRTFGSSLAGGVDLDGNGYPDLAIGAFGADLAMVLKARPVVEVELGHQFAQKYVKIYGGYSCPYGSRTCFSVSTDVRTINRNDTSSILNLREDPFVCELRVVPFAKGVATRALFKSTNSPLFTWPCGRDSVSYVQSRSHELYILDSNQDWVNPVRFNFTIRMAGRSRREISPIVRDSAVTQIFETSFDKKCGDDNDCYTDLTVKPVLLNMTRSFNGTYTSKVTERDSIVIRMFVENRHERAFLAKLYVFYNQDELDEPVLVNNQAGVDLERKEPGIAVVALGNPMEEKHKLLFDMSFNLVRGSSERVSAELVFNVLANSTSIEEYPLDNEWRAEVKLIKEADLQLDGMSNPPIIRFSKGNRHATDEEDIGAQVVHAYTVTNNGPFYAKNVSVTINWPIKLQSDRDEWILYTLEEPIVRHRGQVRKCQIHPSLKAINPLNIYNDETLKLAYSTYGLLTAPKRDRRSVPMIARNSSGNQRANSPEVDFIRTKDIFESSGARVRIVEINCKDNVAICVPLNCHFDYIGTKESAQIEIRARLWNYTFAYDYQRIEYVAITSDGVIEVDPQQGIIENIENNFAKVTTHAYPDRPQQQDKLNIWILIMAVAIGLLLFGLLVLCAHRCGFFKRKRPHEKLLHQAEYKHQRELYSDY